MFVLRKGVLYMQVQSICIENYRRRQNFGVVLIPDEHIVSFMELADELYRSLRVKSRLGLTGKRYAFSKNDKQLIELFPGSSIVSTKEARNDIWQRKWSRVKHTVQRILK